MKPRVLLAGLKRYDNQFTKALKKLGCDVEWTDPDPGKFPLDCDAAIIVTCMISHAKAGDVKDAYKNIALFTAVQGFTEVKEDFEFWLTDFKERTNPVIKVAPTPEKKAYEPPPKQRFVHPEHVLEDVYRVVRECFEASMTGKETAEMLLAQELFKASGELYTDTDVHNIRSKLGLRKKATSASTEKAPQGPGSSDPMELIATVLQSPHLDEKGKLQLIGKIHSGEIRESEIVEHKVVTTGQSKVLSVSRWTIDNPKAETKLSFTQSEAELAARVAMIIKTFSERGSV